MGDGLNYRYFSSSESVSDEEPTRKSQRSRRRSPKSCSKNAVLARQNRLRKKLYLENLENELSALRSDNRSLAKDLRQVKKDNSAMKAELNYLKGILANSTEIHKLLDSINRGLAKPQTPVKAEGPLLSGTSRRCDTPSRGIFNDPDSAQYGQLRLRNGRLAVHLLFTAKARSRPV